MQRTVSTGAMVYTFVWDWVSFSKIVLCFLVKVNTTSYVQAHLF